MHESADSPNLFILLSSAVARRVNPILFCSETLLINFCRFEGTAFRVEATPVCEVAVNVVEPTTLWGGVEGNLMVLSFLHAHVGPRGGVYKFAGIEYVLPLHRAGLEAWRRYFGVVVLHFTMCCSPTYLIPPCSTVDPTRRSGKVHSMKDLYALIFLFW